jgi:hypothetical protein
MEHLNESKHSMPRKKSQKKKNIKKRTVKGKLSLKKVLEAIPGTGGIVTQIADKLQCSTQSVYNYKDKYQEIRLALANEEDCILDLCEIGLFAKIYAQDMDAIRYYLGKKGHKRGYGEGQNPGGINNNPECSGVLVVPAVLSPEQWTKAVLEVTAKIPSPDGGA